MDEPAGRGHARRKGLPVFIAHGRQDQALPFAVAARLERRLREAGLVVTWVPFDGGHEMPAEVVTALNGFLGRLVERAAMTRRATRSGTSSNPSRRTTPGPRDGHLQL